MRQKAVFLDRDGVINRGFNDGYVDHLKKLSFVPRSLGALRRLRRAGYKVIVVSNQAGIGKGIYSAKTLREVTRKIQQTVREKGGRLHAIYYCPHRPEEGCSCRKPKTGLFRKAQRRFGLTLLETAFVGDSRVDIEAGKAIGCRSILVLSGRNKRRPKWEIKPDFVCRDLWDAVTWIFKKDRRKS